MSDTSALLCVHKLGWFDYVHTRVFSLFTLLSSLLCLVGNELKGILIPVDSGYRSTRRSREHRVEAEEVSSHDDECMHVVLIVRRNCTLWFVHRLR